LIEIIVAFIIGIAIGYTMKKPEENTELIVKINTLQDEVSYYKKLTKKLADENMEFRRKQ